MGQNKTILIFICLIGLFISCVDLFEKKQMIYGPYYVSKDPGNLSPTLFLDLGDGNAIGRVSNIKRAGHINKTIVVETQNGYYFIDSKKDNKFLNGTDIIGQLKTNEQFSRLLDSLQIIDFKFDYCIQK